MKKLIVILLAALMAITLLTLTACDNKNKISETEITGNENNPGESDNNQPDKDFDMYGGFIYNTSLTGGNIDDVVLEPGDTYAIISIRGFGDITVKLFPESAPVAVINFINLAENGYYDGKNFHRIMQNFMIQGGSPFGDGTSDPDGHTFGVERSFNARHFYGALSMANSMGQNSQQFFIVNDKRLNDPTLFDIDNLYDTITEGYDFLEGGVDEWGNPFDAFDIAYILHQLDLYKGYLAFRENLTNEIFEKYQNGGAFYLDGAFTVFGHTVDGFDVLDAVSDVEVTDNDEEELSTPVVDVIIESVRIFTQE